MTWHDYVYPFDRWENSGSIRLTDLTDHTARRYHHSQDLMLISTRVFSSDSQPSVVWVSRRENREITLVCGSMAGGECGQWGDDQGLFHSESVTCAEVYQRKRRPVDADGRGPLRLKEQHVTWAKAWRWENAGNLWGMAGNVADLRMSKREH